MVVEPKPVSIATAPGRQLRKFEGPYEATLVKDVEFAVGYGF